MTTQLSTATINNKTTPTTEPDNVCLSPRTLRRVPALHGLNLRNAEDEIQSEDESSATESRYDADSDSAMDTGTESDRSFHDRMTFYHANSSNTTITSIPASPSNPEYPYTRAATYEECGGQKLEDYDI
ncbi:hypothetical protein MPER_11010 [Moniliophthora perniciosa FA553]|nr:hypothetical protein MPER_11010 [Moniliophthora perniciosa FA553]